MSRSLLNSFSSAFIFHIFHLKKKVLNRFISAKILLYKLVIVLCVLSPILMIQTAATWLRPVAPPPHPGASSKKYC